MDQTANSQKTGRAPARPKIIATRDLFNSTLSDYRQNWKKFAYLLVIPLLLSYLGSLASFAFNDIPGTTATWPWQFNLAAAVVFIIFFVGLGALFVLTYISEFLLLKDLSQEASFNNLREWYEKAKPYFWTSIGISIVYTLLAILGFILLIVPGVIFSIFYCFAIYAVIFEGHKFEGSFGRSRELVRGYWWAVFGRFMAGGAVVYLSYIIIGGIYAGIAWLLSYAMHFQAQSSKDLFTLMYDLLSIFIGLVVGPLSMIYTYKIYRSLKEVKNN